MHPILYTRALATLTGAILLLLAVSASGAASTDVFSTPESALKSYLRAAYARNSDAAYALLSSADTEIRSLETYRARNGGFSGAELQLSEELAKAIKFGEFTVVVEGNQATVSFSVELPDANNSMLKGIVEGFDKTRLAELDQSAVNLKLSQLKQLADHDELPFVSSEKERWVLLRENGQWRVFENWGDAIQVSFDAIVMDGLPWVFEPVEEFVLAQPGQTVEMAYVARNTGASEATGKARHIIGPDKHMEHLEIIACFCFFEQTLAAGEQVEMPLVFRVDFDAPDSVKHYSVKYEFYPLDTFPEAAAEAERML